MCWVIASLALTLKTSNDLTLIIHLLGFALQLFDFCTEYRWLVARLLERLQAGRVTHRVLRRETVSFEAILKYCGSRNPVDDRLKLHAQLMMTRTSYLCIAKLHVVLFL